MKYISSGRFNHPTFGVVKVTVRENAVQCTSRWSKGELCVSVPPGTPTEYFAKMLVDLEPRLLAMRPPERFHAGQVIECPGMTFRIVTSRLCPPGKSIGKAEYDSEKIHLSVTITLPDNADFSSPQVQKAINHNLMHYAEAMALDFLIPFAREVAKRVGCTPAGWNIGKGMKRLGSCNSRGEIRLSVKLVLLPPELREFVIIHELAHLTEMNHSARFHALCDKMCGGRERELSAKLKSFRFPVF